MAQIKVTHLPLNNLTPKIEQGILKLNKNCRAALERAKEQTLKSKHESKTHFGLLTSNDNVIGLSILIPTAAHCIEISEIVIHEACRSNGFGRQLLLKSLEFANENDIEFVEVNADPHTKDFFIKNGFILTKEPRREIKPGLREFKLERPDLTFYLDELRASKKDPKRSQQLPLNTSSDTHHYKYSNENTFMVFQRSMLAQAQREITILCDHIVNPLFKDLYVRAALLNVSRRNAQARIRILLEDDKVGAGYHNPVVDLAHKLSSFIEIRAIPHGSTKPGEMITCVDYDSGIYRKNYDSYTGFANFHNHLIAQRLRDNVEQHWQYAKPSMQLRRLSI